MTQAATPAAAGIAPGALSLRERNARHRGNAADRRAFAELAERRMRAAEADTSPRRRPGRTYDMLCGSFQCPSRVVTAGWPQRFAVHDDDLPDGEVWYCSPRCAGAASAPAPRPTAALTRAEHKAECWQCGDWFPTTRSDARYCGPACRQRASRGRKRQPPDLGLVTDPESPGPTPPTPPICDTKPQVRSGGITRIRPSAGHGGVSVEVGPRESARPGGRRTTDDDTCTRGTR